MAEASDQTGSSPAGSATVMVIDPDVLARMVIAEYLRGCGYKVIEGIAAEDVFTVLGSGATIDVVFAEVRLPGEMDGFALAHRIRESHPGTGVILTTSVANAATKAGDLCDDGHLEKPYHPREVVRRINVLRERRRTGQKPE